MFFDKTIYHALLHDICFLSMSSCCYCHTKIIKPYILCNRENEWYDVIIIILLKICF